MDEPRRGPGHGGFLDLGQIFERGGGRDQRLGGRLVVARDPGPPASRA
ncbi:MAG: hypothetical protein WDO24_05505 [Pseudomonadota bacterium]